MDTGQEGAAADAGDAFDEVELPTPPGGSRLSMRFCPIPPGAFWMGERGGNADEEPKHRVVMPYGYWLGKYVVTQEEYRQVVEGLGLVGKSCANGDEWTGSPSRISGNDRHPVEGVSWREAVLWCQALTEWLRNDAHYRDVTVRLPTEMEWEYASRAGTETVFWCGDDEGDLENVAWFGEKYGKSFPHIVDAVRSSDANDQQAFGLVGVHGNVWEWCHDEYAKRSYRYRAAGATAAPPPISCQYLAKRLKADLGHLLRGGAWFNRAESCRSASRTWDGIVARGEGWGFRVCLVRVQAAEQRVDVSVFNAGKGGEQTQAEWRKPRRGKWVCGDLTRYDKSESRSLLIYAGKRTPSAGFTDDATYRAIRFAVIGKIDQSRSCRHTSLDFSTFTGLTHLYLWRLDDLETITGLPENLVCLDVRGCTKLKSLPGGALPHLETLDLGGCIALPGLPSGFVAPALRWLYLDGCTGFEDAGMAPHVLNALLLAATSLEEVSLVDCGWVGSLVVPSQSKNPFVPSVGDPRFPERHLKKLVLRGCTGLTTLPKLSGHSWLHHLDVRGCAKLEAMPALPVGEDEQGRPTGIRTLYATGCNAMTSFLGLDIRRVHRGESTATLGESAAAGQEVNVAGQFRTLSTLAEDPAELRMAKVLFLGSGRCGKTTVAKALRWCRYSTAERAARRNSAEDPCPDGGQRSTPNIRLDALPLPSANAHGKPGSTTDVHIWDFGGQEIYHNTHRLFASEGAVFVIVTTLPTVQTERVEHDIGVEETNGLSAEDYQRQNIHRPVSYWLDYVWEARGLPAGSLDPKHPRAPRVLVVVTGTTSSDEAAAHVRQEAGERYRGCFDDDAPLKISVIAANLQRATFEERGNVAEKIANAVALRAAAAADELGINVPALYAALARRCTGILESNQRIRKAAEKGLAIDAPRIEQFTLRGWTDEVVAADPVKKRSARERREIAAGLANYFHECGRVFRMAKADTVVVDQQWAVQLVYDMVVASVAVDRTRAEIHAITHNPFSAARFRQLFDRNPAVQEHWDFLLGLLDACNLVIRRGDDELFAVHPELLPPLTAAKAGELVKDWDGVAAGPDQGQLVNHSFAIHDTGDGLLLGRNAFQNVVATVGRIMHHGLPWHLFFGEGEPDWPASWTAFSLDEMPFETQSYFWRDGFQFLWRTGSCVLPRRECRDGSREQVPEQVLGLRMEWKNGTSAGGFRGGIFVQMLCSEENVKASQLRSFLFDKAPADREEPSGRDSSESAPPLAGYRLGGDDGNLLIHDRRLRDLPPAQARSLRGVGQPGWLHRDSPEQQFRFDVAISYRRKDSGAFVQALHAALEGAEVSCFYDCAPPRKRSKQNQLNLTFVYDALRRARVLIVVPSAGYFESPKCEVTEAVNTFCPVELAEAVVAGTRKNGSRPAGQFFWVASATGGNVVGQYLIDSVSSAIEQAHESVTNWSRSKDFEAVPIQHREARSVERARQTIRAQRSRWLAWRKAVGSGENQILIVPSGDAGKSDFSQVVARIREVLADSPAPRKRG
ncbi:MAG: Serine/threonine-protein kinase pkn1 [Planctomycetota bacterium]|jgi:formylglycine-generating enzyme required for sulfatase activity